ncbi:hypothetical protein [Chryseobacterium paludis]|uniref:hypothetical protein n=1 Tax=Chryseobacterium paludis TaxID=2956784 RepID=UPI0021C1197F|nr:hypothetical protein [Chryseobacterium paludis]
MYQKAKAIVALPGVNRKTSNAKAKTVLGWQPQTNEDAILATLKSLVQYNSLQQLDQDLSFLD